MSHTLPVPPISRLTASSEAGTEEGVESAAYGVLHFSAAFTKAGVARACSGQRAREGMFSTTVIVLMSRMKLGCHAR